MDDLTKDKKIFRSDEIIKHILDGLNLTRKDASTCESSTTQDGKFLRLRISSHGVNMSSWYRNNDGQEIPLTESDNIALTFLPNKEECQEQGIPFTTKAINKTTVYVFSTLGIPNEFALPRLTKTLDFIYLLYLVEQPINHSNIIL